MQSVAAYGELRLITEIKRWLGNVSPKTPFGIGDDCAVIPPTKRHQLVTTDPVIYGQHFDDTVRPQDVGAKLLKRNLSDIAAMGGRPVAAVISLALAPETDIAWLKKFYLGLAATARAHHVRIVGGDITQGPAGFIGAFLTLHGESTGKRVITRTGASAGDHIYVTGNLGGSLAGHHYNFAPRLAEGRWLAGRSEVRAMMDVSDGIAKDLDSLTTRGLKASLNAATIPVSRAAQLLAKKTQRTALEHALCDGEDFELLIVVRQRADISRFERAWKKRFPRVPLSRIGHFVSGKKLLTGALNLSAYRGYEHLR
ncbi:thiamine-phosphate kinase [Oleiharenicola lentus]|uniref:thiamine-phosphate kinase n=1 Tax=Oleiharenicola lentus TaxID=2508720 RepID=UPI003F672F84